MSYGGSNTTYTDTPSWNDPLGPTSLGKPNSKGQQLPTYDPSGTGGPAQRSTLFSTMDQAQPAINQSRADLTTGLQNASANPGWGGLQNNALATIRGDYLSGSPELQGQLDANTRSQLAASADENARTQSEFERSGMGFSTGSQEAAQAGQAAAAARAGEQNAQLIGSNYQAERARQTAGADQLQSAESGPLNYLQNISSANLAPIASEASIVSGLSSGGPISTPSSTIVKNPGVGDYLSGAFSSY